MRKLGLPFSSFLRLNFAKCKRCLILGAVVDQHCVYVCVCVSELHLHWYLIKLINYQSHYVCMYTTKKAYAFD